MKELSLLIKINLLSLFDINKSIYTEDKRQKRKFMLFSLLMIFVFISIIITAFSYSFALASSLESLGALNALIAIMMTATSLLILFTSIYKVNGTLFGFKDYDTIMSLPVGTGIVVASRIFILYIYNFAFNFIVMVPAVIVYSIKTPPNVLFYLYFIVSFFLIPLIPIVIATIIGVIINIISSRFKRNNIVNIVFTIGFLLLAMFFSYSYSFSMNEQNVSELGNLSISLMNMIYKSYPPTKLFTEGVCEGNFISFFLFSFISLVLFIAFCFIIGKNFKKLNTSLSAVYIKKNYKISPLKESSPLISLYKKEFRRYFASTIYVINTGFGPVLLVVLSLGVLFLGVDKIEEILKIPEFAQNIGDIAPFIIALYLSMTYTTACSISLEGKHLWIAKSLPVRPLTIFLSKILVNLTITVPAVLISALSFSITLKTDVSQTLLLFLTPLVFSVFSAVFGIIINLHLPNFDWKTEVVAVKQSAASFVAIFGGILVSIIPIFAIIKLRNNISPTILAFIITLITFIFSVISFRYIAVKGEKIFNGF